MTTQPSKSTQKPIPQQTLDHIAKITKGQADHAARLIEMAQKLANEGLLD
ncbi:hypothetical protein [Xanthobacter agilis]|uniref:Uncharacterized protein n=1 Tax=Xanthobacter agilis TaxID=47492 RepID=A0ABU0LFR2_XANAG|nr:hypothetical protein [Xanthobacter agilis]MDQ0505984.1 hypothetical protein [Xanthobacter agilis]